MNKLIFLLLFTTFAFAGEPFCYFDPPKKWEVSHPSSLSPRIKIGFVAPRKKGFVPSMNLALEEAKVPLNQYVSIVKKLHQKDPSIRYYSLGTLSLPFGKAHLTQIDLKNEYGEIRLYQLLSKYGDYAIVLSAAALKSEFSKLKEELLASFQSLHAYEDIYTSLDEEEKKRIDLWKSSDQSLEEFIQSQFSDKGIPWQLFAIQTLHEVL